MRKIKTVVLCVILSAMLCGCANNKEGSSGKTVSTKNLTDPYSYTDGGNISYYFE